MTEVTRQRQGEATATPGARRGSAIPWTVFLIVHLWLAAHNLLGSYQALGDVNFVYKVWVEQGFSGGGWVGIHSGWVYPIVALVPIAASALFGFAGYQYTWIGLAIILNAVGFAFLLRWRGPVPGYRLAEWWLAFLLLLGPIALGRIDSITIPFAIIGMLLLGLRPRLAAVLLTVVTWIKVWPAALLGAIVLAHRARRRVLAAIAATSAVIVALAVALGGGRFVFSFVTVQAGRGLQIEAPVSTFWLWQAFAGVPGVALYYDRALLTYQVRGPGVAEASGVMTPILAVAVLAILGLAVAALRKRPESAALLPSLALALVVAVIAFNKVGSPQYMTWLAAPVLLGLSLPGTRRSFRVPAILALVLALLTQVIYPYFYDDLLALHPTLLIVITLRNLLLFVLLGWAVRQLGMLAFPAHQAAPRSPAHHDSLTRFGSLTQHDSLTQKE